MPMITPMARLLFLCLSIFTVGTWGPTLAGPGNGPPAFDSAEATGLTLAQATEGGPHIGPPAFDSAEATGLTLAQATEGGPHIAAAPSIQDEPRPFGTWLEGMIAEARMRGFAEPLIQEALAGLEPLERVIESDRSQPEATLTFNSYSSARVSRTMITRGKDVAKTHRSLLNSIEKTYGVQRRFVLAVWGLESRFGRLQGSTPVFQSLATLAWEPRRATYFRGELFNALMMVDRGYIDAGSMKGSWAGAMGQTQFMPSSYLTYAVDFDGDGRRNIWASTPDVLGSIANYLKGFNWDDTQTWGREVFVPEAAKDAIAEIPKRTGGSCAARRNMTEHRPLTEWRKLGVRRVDKGPLPQADAEGGLVTVDDRTFLVYRNYDALLGYNCAHLYALTVGLLSDALR